jgi:lipoate-protein ligase A
MRFLDVSLPTAAENLALDEALLDEAEASVAPLETLRFWESPGHAVVLGRSSRAEVEARLDECDRLGVPVLRRISGGAAIVAGPGCLMYSVVLSYRRRPELRNLAAAHRWVLGMIAESLAPFVPDVCCRGTSDLAIGTDETTALKFSGNSARCRRESFLYHGTLLYDFPLELIERLLGAPPRTPAYRGGRSHGAFVVNLPLLAEALRRTIAAAFRADEPCLEWPRQRTAQLVAEKYALKTWNLSGR